jgi:L-iditol 2-dehydrogenase
MIRRVVIEGPGALRLEEYDNLSTPPPGQARLRPLAIGICGSDLHVLAGHHPFVTYPVYPGHEVVAVVEGVGDSVDSGWLGRRVALEPSLACGACRACLRGAYNLCESLRVMGFQVAGGMADLFDAPTERLHHLPNTLAHDGAALVEPTAVAVHAAHLAGNLQGASVAVVGAGTIGLLCAQVARAEGASVVLCDIDANRRWHAGSLGFETRPDLEPRAYDVTFECVGVGPALRTAVASTRKGGSVLVVGVYGNDPQVQAGLIQDFELRLQGALMYTGRDYARAIELLQRGVIEVSALISAHVPLAEVERGFATAGAGGRALKVLVTPG